MPFDILNAKTVQESAENLDLVKAYAEAIEQYGRDDLTYWKDKLFAKQLSDADTLEPLEVKEDTGTVTNKQEQQPSNMATRQPFKVQNKTSKKRKATKSGFKHPPKVVAGIKVWGSDNMSDSGDEAVRDYKKIKLELEEDGDLPSMQQGRAPTPQSSTVKEEDTSTKHPLQTGRATKKEVELEDDKSDALFLSPPPQSPALGQRASNPNTYSGMFGRDETPYDPLAESVRVASTRYTTPFLPNSARTQKSPSRPSFEKIMSPATTNGPRAPSARFVSPDEPCHTNQQTYQYTSTEPAGKKLANPLFPILQQPTNTHTSTPPVPANSSTPPPK